MGGVEHLRRQQETRFRDGSWDHVTVLAQGRDRGGGWRILLRWFDGSTHEGWFLFDRARFRDVPREPP
jgi:hypothetical protein